MQLLIYSMVGVKVVHVNERVPWLMDLDKYSVIGPFDQWFAKNVSKSLTYWDIAKMGNFTQTIL